MILNTMQFIFFSDINLYILNDMESSLEMVFFTVSISRGESEKGLIVYKEALRLFSLDLLIKSHIRTKIFCIVVITCISSLFYLKMKINSFFFLPVSGMARFRFCEDFLQ